MARLDVAAQMEHEEHALRAVEQRGRSLVGIGRPVALTHQRHFARARQQILGVGGGVDHERRHHQQTRDHVAATTSGFTWRATSRSFERRSHSAAAAISASAGGTDQ